MRRGRGVALAGLVLAASALPMLSACSVTRAGPDSGGTATPAAPTTTPAPYTAGPTPSDTTTAPTEQTQLRLGQSRVVDWSPKQGLSGRLRISVTAIYEANFSHPEFSGWEIDQATRERRPYFVEAKVTNVGDTDLGGFDVPLYGLDDANDLVQASSFGDTTFQACPHGVLPAAFGAGKSLDACLVILVPKHGHLLGVSFRPDENDTPITWQGPIKPYHQKKSS